MAIKTDEFINEEKILQNTNNWMDKQLEKMEKNNIQLENKLAELKKQSKGAYSYDVETTTNLYNITSKILNNYKEVKDKPYFARIDFEEITKRNKESFYIGKIGLMDEVSGEEVVVDWRAPIADLYYNSTSGRSYYEAPIGKIEGELLLKRKFVIKDRKLIDAFDEGIDQIILKSKSDEDGNTLQDEFLRINLEEGVNGKLKDIVATIQKEQNEVIRAERGKGLIVQGSAGSGKTTIALHRLAYLLYKYRNKISGKNVLVIAPNKLFLDYISDILPNLGVEDVKQKTFEELALEILKVKLKINPKDKKLAYIIENNDVETIGFIKDSSSFKSSMQFKECIDRYIEYIESYDMDYEDIIVDGYVIIRGDDIKRLFTEDLAHNVINKRKQEIKRYLFNKIDNKIANISADIEKQYYVKINKVRASKEDGPDRRKELTELYDERDAKIAAVKADIKAKLNEYVNEWGNEDVVHLYERLFVNEKIFNRVIGDKVTGELAEYMREKFTENMQDKVIDSDDLAAMIYLKFRIKGIEDKYKYQHIVIDEAQDYSFFELLALRQMAIGDSFTIVGDTGQSIYYYKGINDWKPLVERVFNKDVTYTELTQSYRSTVEIVNFANRVLRKQENSLEPAKPVLRHGKEPSIIKYDSKEELCSILDDIVKDMTSINKKNIAIICKDYNQCNRIKNILAKASKNKWKLIKDTDKKISLDKIILPSYMTKGLEFDCAIVMDCDNDNYGDNELDKRLLYVVLTRALHRVYIMHNKPLSALLE